MTTIETKARENNTLIDLEKNQLYMDCYQFLHSEKLELPTIPDVSFKIRRAINDKNANSNRIARVVQIDPSITARLIKIANSPLYIGRRKIESCPEALTRMGLKAAQSIITSFALKSVFKARSPVIRTQMMELWNHSSYVAAISAVLAHKTPGFDPDRAMLAGLIHDIGIVPILQHADKWPELISNPKELAEAIKHLKTEIGLKIIRNWDFPEDFEDIIINCENWTLDDHKEPNYTDIVIISQLHSFIGTQHMKNVPRIDQLPAYRKLAAGRLDTEASINILDTARDEIQQIQQLLS